MTGPTTTEDDNNCGETPMWWLRSSRADMQRMANMPWAAFRILKSALEQSSATKVYHVMPFVNTNGKPAFLVSYQPLAAEDKAGLVLYHDRCHGHTRWRCRPSFLPGRMLASA